MDMRLALLLIGTISLAWMLATYAPNLGWRKRVLNDVEVYERLSAIVGENPSKEERAVLSSLRASAFAATARGQRRWDRLLEASLTFVITVLMLTMLGVAGSVVVSVLLPDAGKIAAQFFCFILLLLVLAVSVFVVMSALASLFAGASRKGKHGVAKDGHDRREEEPDEGK